MDSREGSEQPVIFLGCVDDPLEGSLVCCSATGVPRRDAVGQYTFDSGAVEGHLQITLQVVFPEYSGV